MSQPHEAGTLVWAQTETDPCWPAMIIEEQNAPLNVTQTQHTEGQVLVCFFGQPVSYGWMDVYFPFREHFHTYCHETRPDFLQALEEALEYERNLEESRRVDQFTNLFVVQKSSKITIDDKSTVNESNSGRLRLTRTQPKAQTITAKLHEDDNSKKQTEFDTVYDEEDEKNDPAFAINKAQPSPRSRAQPARKHRTTPRQQKASSKVKTPIESTRKLPFKYNAKLVKEVYLNGLNIKSCLKNNDIEQALVLLKRFNPSPDTTLSNSSAASNSLKLQPINHISKIQAYELHKSRLGKLIHCLTRHSDPAIAICSQELYHPLVEKVKKEFEINKQLQSITIKQSIPLSTINIAPSEDIKMQ